MADEGVFRRPLYACITLSLTAVFVEVGIILSAPSSERHSNLGKICLPETDVLTCGPLPDRLTAYLSEQTNGEYKRQSEEEKNKNKDNLKSTIQLKAFLKDHTWAIKPAARVVGADVEPTRRPYDQVSDMSPIRNWELGHNSYRRYGITYRDGRLVVPVSGTYLIYCFIDMYEEWNRTTDRPVNDCSSSIKHSIYKYNILNGTEQELMCSETPHQISSNGYYNIYTSYLSSVVELKAGDEVYVKVSEISLLTNPHMNFFGIHMI